MLVKEDKPHSCYHFFKLLDNLKEMSAEEFAEEIKGKPENLGCTTAYDLVYNVSTRFKSVQSFRTCIAEQPENIETIKTLPLMLLD
jgi:hypothetical protein